MWSLITSLSLLYDTFPQVQKKGSDCEESQHPSKRIPQGTTRPNELKPGANC
jgi:hypothetical protein